jgi:hypothetical protein
MNALAQQFTAAAAKALKTERVEFPEMGITVEVVGMTAGQHAAAIEAATVREGKTTRIVDSKLVPRLLSGTVRDPETKEPLWNGNVLEDHTSISSLPLSYVKRLVETVQRLSGVSEEAVDELGNDSGRTPTDEISSS